MASLVRPVRSLFGGVRTTALVNIGSTVVGGATGVLLARALGPGPRGELVAAAVGPQLIAALMSLGVDEALVYLLARAPGESEVHEVYGTALIVTAGLGLLAAGMSELLQWLFFGPTARSVSPLALYIFGSFPLVSIATQSMLGALRARQQYSSWNACRIWIPAANLGVLVAIAWMHKLSASSALLALYSSNLAVLVFLATRLRIETGFRASRSKGAALVRLGVQHHLIDVGQLINLQLDQVVLTRLVNTTQLGYYSISATYASLALGVAVAPALHLFSQASKEGRIAPDRFRALQRRTSVYLLAVAMVSALAAPVFMTIAFGRAFAPAALPAVVLVFGAPPLALCALRAAAWKASGRPLPAAYAQGAGVIVTAVGLAFLAPRLGIMGAAITSVVAYTSVAAVLLRLRGAPVVRF